MTDTFLDKAYGTTGTDATRTLYTKWAASYEAEVGENGYATPARCAKALANVITDFDLPVLDFGCGTGLSGLALSMAGFQTIDGMDLTQEMLDLAHSKQLYRQLQLSDPDVPLPIKKGDYSAISAIGVIGSGAAPIEVFDMLFNVLESKAKFVFSFNDHTLEDAKFEARVRNVVSTNEAILLFEEYGDHLPGQNMKSKVYVLEKT